MKKILLGASLFACLTIFSNSASGQTFQDAIDAYKIETGGTTYEGMEITPMWFRHKKVEYDLNKDGIVDGYTEWDEFWIFGHRIWRGPITSNPS